jgi:fructose 5-dehydrogenase small subunit
VKRPHSPEVIPPFECRTGTTRRTFLLTTAAVTSGLGILAGPAGVRAQPSPTGTFSDADFLRLSQVATGFTDLDATTASRLLAALHRADPLFIDRATTLAHLDQHELKPEALLSAAEAVGLGETMLALIAAWYTGTVGHGQQAEMISYAEALMYRPVSDGIPAPTYCLNGPLWWTEPPPSAGIEAPPATKGG